MAATLVVTLSLDDTQSHVQQLAQPSANQGMAAIKAVSRYVNSIGVRRQGSIRVQTGGAAPVRATGTATLASVAANDTIVIGGTTLTAKASPANENEFSQAGSDTADAASLVTKINAHSTLSQVVKASSSGAVVTITCLVPGVIGNHITLAQTGGTITLSAAKLSGGTGGSTEEGTLWGFGI